MPGSSVRDASPASASSPPFKKDRKKRKQKLTAGDDPGSKKKDKSTKDNGGVVAAVTRHGAKFDNGDTAKDAVPPPDDSPLGRSPELKPAAPTTIPTNKNLAASPLLDAVSTTSVSASTAPSTNDWTRAIGGNFAGSPSNLISIMGDSPPTGPSSYEDSRATPYAWTMQQQQQGPRPFMNNSPYSASPPPGGRRPLSFQLDQYAANDIRSQASSPPGVRRSSMHSPFAPPRITGNPPLPHQPQPHFYGTPQIDFDVDPKIGLKAGERGYYFGFDTIPRPGRGHVPRADKVVLAGYEGGLDVYSVGKRGIEPLAILKGLRGGVYDAKILPWNVASDPAHVFPLIALVIHGPVLPPSAPEIAVETHLDETLSPRLEGIRTPQSDSHARQINLRKTVPMIEAYQTSIEVYSLATNKLIDVLLQAPKTPFKTSVSSPIFKSPPPSGALQIRADDAHVVISSGITGECWIFRYAKFEPDLRYEFRCVGKLWTTLQQATRSDAGSEEGRSQSPIPPRKRPQMAILAVSGRWLAYCPPPPSSQIALNASVLVPLEGKAPGLTTLTSPVLPNESSDVDQPFSNSMVNRIMRETTQEVIQGARWVGKQGMQLWNNYWKPGQQPTSRQPTVGSPPWGSGLSGRSDTSQFPPTYGVSGQAVTKEPGLVSLLDLHVLASSAAIHHITTFKAPLGCSFLSFSPTGLSLFTASSKGDVQTVWDLLRIQHTKSSTLQYSQPNGGHATRVRQVAQFSRMTVARIVDIAWTRPNGDRIAMVTERGTVHLLDMPPTSFAWPPPRRRVKASEGSTGGTEATTPSAVSIASSALSSAYGATRPLINRQRRSSSNGQGPSTIMDHASYGGKVLAAGIGHSLGNAGTAINQLRHTGENRVSLPLGGNMSPGSSWATWITGRKYHTLYVLGEGLVRSFPSKTRKPATGLEKTRSARINRHKDFKLKNLPDDLIAPSIKQIIDPIDALDLTQQDQDVAHTLVLQPRPKSSESDHSPEAAIPQAEIESSAPYQPFHTDRRIGLYVYNSESADVSSISCQLESTMLGGKPQRTKDRQGNKLAPQSWAFGQVIKTVKIDVGLPNSIEEDVSGSIDDHRALPVSAMERVLQVGDNDEQIVVTTRRRRGGSRTEGADEDGFFEDDCEVLDFADQRV